MQTNRKYKAVIIGCGNIAGGYDSPGDKNVFTHAHAISLHKRIVLSGVYDILHKKAKRFSRKWDTVPFTSIDEMFDNVHPDLVYVCVPTHAHLKVLENILTYKPRAVICEKPFGDDSNSAERMVTNYKKSSIPLLVNYNRRFDPVISRIKDNINRGYYGSFVNASLIYTKGILHNGCHVIDLLRYFFGEIRSYRILGANFDYKKEDPTLDVFLQFKGNIKAHLIAACELAYSIFEADFLFSKARIRLEQFGSKMILQVARDDPVFKGYRDLNKAVKQTTGLNRALLKLIDNIIEHIEKGKELLCSAENALKTQKVCLELIKQYKVGNYDSGKKISSYR